jgi:hypothetical protein
VEGQSSLMKRQSSVAVPEICLVTFKHGPTSLALRSQVTFFDLVEMRGVFCGVKPLGQSLVHDTMEKKLSKIVKRPRDLSGEWQSGR